VYSEIGWKNGASTWSERELADLAGMSRHSLRSARDELLQDEWITVDETGPGQAGSPLVTLVNVWPRSNAYFEHRGDGSPQWRTNGSNVDHSIEPGLNGSNMDQAGRPVDHSPEIPAGRRTIPGRPVDHSELPLKTKTLRPEDVLRPGDDAQTDDSENAAPRSGRIVYAPLEVPHAVDQ